MKNEHLLDELDYAILRELRTDCRRSFRELAKVLKLSPASLIERMKKLKKHGIIKKYSADLDFVRMGYEFNAFIHVRITKGAQLEVQKKIASLPSVAAVYDVTGEYDSLVYALCKSRSELSVLIKRINNIEEVQRTNTTLSLNVIKEVHEFSF